MLLNSLPDFYKHLVMTLFYTKKKKQKDLEEVSGALLEHYQWKEENSAEILGEWLVVKGYQDCGRKKDKNEQSNRGRSKFKNKTMKCYKCYKNGISSGTV